VRLRSDSFHFVLVHEMLKNVDLGFVCKEIGEMMYDLLLFRFLMIIPSIIIPSPFTSFPLCCFRLSLSLSVFSSSFLCVLYSFV